MPKLIRKYPKIKKATLSMFYFINHFKQVRLICKTIDCKFKSAWVFPCLWNFSMLIKLHHAYQTFSCLWNFSMLLELFHAYENFSLIMELPCLCNFSYLWNFFMLIKLFHVYRTFSFWWNFFMFMALFHACQTFQYLQNTSIPIELLHAYPSCLWNFPCFGTFPCLWISPCLWNF